MLIGAHHWSMKTTTTFCYESFSLSFSNACAPCGSHQDSNKRDRKSRSLLYTLRASRRALRWELIRFYVYTCMHMRRNDKWEKKTTKKKTNLYSPWRIWLKRFILTLDAPYWPLQNSSDWCKPLDWNIYLFIASSRRCSALRFVQRLIHSGLSPAGDGAWVSFSYILCQVFERTRVRSSVSNSIDSCDCAGISRTSIIDYRRCSI